jgi:hypothetical protein
VMPTVFAVASNPPMDSTTSIAARRPRPSITNTHVSYRAHRGRPPLASLRSLVAQGFAPGVRERWDGQQRGGFGAVFAA